MAEPYQVTPQTPSTPPSFESPRRKPKSVKSLPVILITVAFLVVAGLGYIAGSATSGTLQGKINVLLGKEEIDLSSVQQTYQALVENFDGELSQQDLIEGANRGLVEAADDQYTVYMNRAESTSFDDALTGNIGGGVGIEVGMRSNVPTVVRVLQNNPAEKSGIAVGDVITHVNDESVKDKTLNEVVLAIRGEVDTTVKLTVLRTGTEKVFSITRQQVNNPSAYGEIKDNVGILTITRFDGETGSLARAVARDFKEKNVEGVVLDLRGNGGGYVTAAQAVSGIWLDKQVVTTERRGGQVVEELKSTGTPILNGIPTVVLVNESSASASEIVAGALHDHKSATLVGATTFGKGSVQKLITLPEGATLKVTIARWYTPAGVNISEKGIVPEIQVERTADDINANRDPQLEAALKAI